MTEGWDEGRSWEAERAEVVGIEREAIPEEVINWRLVKLYHSCIVSCRRWKERIDLLILYCRASDYTFTLGQAR